MPVGVLFGDGDRILDPALHGEGLRRNLPAMIYKTLPDGGHMIPFTRPDETASFIEEMAAKAGLGAGPADPAP